MQTIILRPYDDKDIVEVFLVEHKDKPGKVFEKAYDKALEAVKKESPEEWQLNDCLANLENEGWQIIRPNTITLEY
jgi:hypothetical protein